MSGINYGDSLFEQVFPDGSFVLSYKPSSQTELTLDDDMRQGHYHDPGAGRKKWSKELYSGVNLGNVVDGDGLIIKETHPLINTEQLSFDDDVARRAYPALVFERPEFIRGAEPIELESNYALASSLNTYSDGTPINASKASELEFDRIKKTKITSEITAIDKEIQRLAEMGRGSNDGLVRDLLKRRQLLIFSNDPKAVEIAQLESLNKMVSELKSLKEMKSGLAPAELFLGPTPSTPRSRASSISIGSPPFDDVKDYNQFLDKPFNFLELIKDTGKYDMSLLPKELKETTFKGMMGFSKDLDVMVPQDKEDKLIETLTSRRAMKDAKNYYDLFVADGQPENEETYRKAILFTMKDIAAGINKVGGSSPKQPSKLSSELSESDGLALIEKSVPFPGVDAAELNYLEAVKKVVDDSKVSGDAGKIFTEAYDAVQSLISAKGGKKIKTTGPTWQNVFDPIYNFVFSPSESIPMDSHYQAIAAIANILKSDKTLTRPKGPSNGISGLKYYQVKLVAEQFTKMREKYNFPASYFDVVKDMSAELVSEALNYIDSSKDPDVNLGSFIKSKGLL